MDSQAVEPRESEFQTGGNGKSGWSASDQADSIHPAMAIRPRGNEKDRAVALGIAATQAHERGRGPGTKVLETAPRAHPPAGPIQNV